MTILPTVIYRFNAIPIKLINFLGVWASLIAQLVKMHLQCRRPGFDPWAGKIPWRRDSLPTAVFCMENSMDCIIHGVTKSWIQLNNFHFHFTFNWASLIGQSVKNLPAVQETRVRSLVRKIPWRRKWQPTPAFLPGESHRQRILAGYSPWGCKSIASLVAQLIKNPPAMQETWVQSLGWKDRLEKGKATHSSILAWRISWTV